MKKILFVVESLSGGGAEKVLLTLVKNLNKEKYDITVFTIVETGIYVDEMKKYCQVKSALKDYNEYSVIGRLYYKIKMKLIYNLNIKFVYRWLIKKKYDTEIAFVEGFDTKLVAASNNKNSKKYAWVHIDMIANSHADIHFKDLLEEQITYRKYDKIFAVSNDVKENFIKKFKIKKVFVQYNPIDSLEIISKSIEEKNPYKDNEFNIVTIGRLEKQKGYNRLLRIVSQLKSTGYHFKLYILGNGSQKEELENYIVDNDLYDYVQMVGFKKNPYPYLKNADLFVCSSYSEGFSTVATEALILGVPIITTECNGMRELFGEYECGIICDNNGISLRQAIIKVLQEPQLLEKYKKEIELRRNFFKLEKRMNEIEEKL